MPDAATLRLGVLRSATGYHEGVDAVFEGTLEQLSAGGVTLVDVEIDSPEAMGDDTYKILIHEFRTGINDYLATLPAPRNEWTLDTLIAFNEANAEREMKWFRQEHFESARDQAEEAAEVYPEALARVRQATRNDGIDRLVTEHDLDAIVAPTRGPAWKIDLVNGDNYGGGFSTYPAVSGYPHLTLPMGRVHGLPIGLSVTGAARSDATIMAIGALIEDLGVGDTAWP